MAKLWTKENVVAGVVLPGKIDDIPELKEELIDVFLTKSHKAVSRYSVVLAEHIFNLANMQPNDALRETIAINIKWQEGNAPFQEARNVAGRIFTMAREEKDPVKTNILRVLGQAAATPHVARHALIASDYAIKLVNLLYPKDFEEVRKEREIQIEMMRSI
jgi:regulator of RNase E activity RraA